ncbi:hypothetical protein WJX72_004165 [[Myrmecia] bisecta]|uniref:Plasma membrane ATPase n=1 Tax=[Myrmecia] bisecta TaxID=41462 RepID=A0AAW1QBG7_9CHLO
MSKAPAGLSTAEVAQLQQQHGLNEVAAEQVPAWKKVAWRYLDWVSLVILASAIISAAVPNEGQRGWTSFVLLILELNLVVWVGYYSERNAGNAIKELEALSAPYTTVRRDGSWQKLAVRELVPGDLIQLKGGDVVPADGKLVGDEDHEPLTLDESSLTGESLPVLAGAVVTQGELDALVTATGKDSFFGKTMTLLGGPEEAGHLKKVLNRVSVAMAGIALIGVLIIMAVLFARNRPAGYIVVTVFVIFVAVTPIGMAVVTTTVLALGARELAKEKAIVSRLSALEELSGMEVLASDKTGTLTLNRLTLDKSDILAWGGASQDEVLLMASLSARWSHNDAIDKAVVDAMGGDEKAIVKYTIKKFVPFNPVDKKTTATVVMPDGSTILTSKGAPQASKGGYVIIADMLADKAAARACESYIEQRASRGLRSLGVAKSLDNGSTWGLVGLISLLDPPREDTAETIRRAQEMGVVVKMVTGDQTAIAIETSRRLGLGTNIMEGKELMSKGAVDLDLASMVDHVDGFAGVYPEHKHRIVEALQAKGRLVGMTGDGVNDAPALKKANIGIAVAGATAAAKGAADIILTQEGISTIITAISRSRAIFRRLQTYIIYRMASSLLILAFFFLAIIAFDFEMPTWVLVLISLFNDLSVMAVSFDKVYSAAHPEKWNMVRNMCVAISIAAVGTAGMVLLLPLADPLGWNVWTAFDTVVSVEPADTTTNTSGEMVAVIFLGLSVFIQLNIILTRNPGFWWRFSRSTAPRPSFYLLAPVAFFLTASTFIAVYWPRSLKPDGGRGSMEGAYWGPIALTWAYVLVWWALADLAKFATQRLFDRQERIKEECKENDKLVPAWVRALDAPGNWGNQLSRAVERATKVAGKKFCGCLPKTRRRGVLRPPSMAEIDNFGQEPSRVAVRRRTKSLEAESEWGVLSDARLRPSFTAQQPIARTSVLVAQADQPEICTAV